MTPVAVFAYKRPEHMGRLLASLAHADGAAETHVTIFADGARDANDTAGVEATRETARAATGFASVRVVERQGNMGLAKNIIDGVGQILEKEESVIVLEDDLTVSPAFLTYMNAALDFYRDKGIFSVAGYTPDINLPSGYQHTTYAMNRNCSWGWATWRDRWEKVDWEVGDFKSFIRNADRRKAFNKCGNDLTPMLLRQQTGKINSWSIRFCYAGFSAGMPTIYPTLSLVRNDGADGSGTNVGRTSKFKTKLAAAIDTGKFTDDILPDEKIVGSFRRKYNTSVIRQIINKIKLWRYLTR